MRAGQRASLRARRRHQPLVATVVFLARLAHGPGRHCANRRRGRHGRRRAVGGVDRPVHRLLDLGHLRVDVLPVVQQAPGLCALVQAEWLGDDVREDRCERGAQPKRLGAARLVLR